ncbi:alkaline phosphatase family protein [Amycolatopsis orientalis]|uniref:alkaline phosphatase family protein n=1 Tax=Amycolatopsis orientalis TaxID=31958 RepID=UPI0003A0FE5B|nr:alkaline phosphatase family protein [Amycolatopsis orientalis]
MRTAHRGAAAFLALALTAAACSSPAPPAAPPAHSSSAPSTPSPASGALPRPDHVVVVVLENHGSEDITGSPDAGYLNQLAAAGARFTHATAVTHPSQPNYLALFSGSTQGVTDDSCPHTFTAPNLARQLLDAGRSFAAYAEDLPAAGYAGCQAGDYVRWHAPWTDFANVPPSANRPFSEFGPDFAKLPTIAFVIPNMCHNMHNCGAAVADAWLRAHLSGYVAWATAHNSLLVVTFDEAEDASAANQIPLSLTGPMVRPGSYAEPVDHYRLLRSLEALYGLPPVGGASNRSPISDVWQH